MVTVRVVPNRAGARELLKSPELRRELERRAGKVATQAGPGHLYEVTQTGDRLRGMVWTATNRAKAREARDRNLTRALDAGRG